MQTPSDVIFAEHDYGDRATHQNANRTSVEVETRPGKLGVAVEVVHLPHFRPGRIDTQGDERQQQVDDPDTEVLAALARELQLLRRAGALRLPSGGGFGNLRHRPKLPADYFEAELA